MAFFSLLKDTACESKKKVIQEAILDTFQTYYEREMSWSGTLGFNRCACRKILDFLASLLVYKTTELTQYFSSLTMLTYNPIQSERILGLDLQYVKCMINGSTYILS